MINYFIFSKEKNCRIEKIAENDFEKNYFLQFFPEGKSVECTNIEFTDVKKGLKNCFLDESGNVILKENNEKFLFSTTFKDDLTNENIIINRTLIQLQNLFKSAIDSQILTVSAYINNYPNDVIWSNYLNKLKSIDINNIDFPIEKSFQAWFLEQKEVPNKSILQLP
jgi:hypothetical protein